MTFYAFVHNYLLWFSFIFLPVVLATRFLFFVYHIVKSTGKIDQHRWKYLVSVLSRSLLPLHRIIFKKPFYTSFRFIFHIVLIVLPLWLPMHIFTSAYSRLGWVWTPLPLDISEVMTIAVILFCAVFLLHRVILTKNRKKSTPRDFLFLIIIVLPYATGFLSVHDPFKNHLSFLSNNMYTLHVFTGEIMLIIIGFLFLNVYLDNNECIACGACAENCPTLTLRYQDNKRMRSFYYSHYQCIICSTCVSICPVSAVSLKHSVSLKEFMQFKPKHPILTQELIKCDQCERNVASFGQLAKIEQSDVFSEQKLCERCRKLNAAQLME